MKNVLQRFHSICIVTTCLILREEFWHKDGHSVPVEYTSTPIKDTDGTITGAVVVFRDITERQNHIETQILYSPPFSASYSYYSLGQTTPL